MYEDGYSGCEALLASTRWDAGLPCLLVLVRFVYLAAFSRC